MASSAEAEQPRGGLASARTPPPPPPLLRRLQRLARPLASLAAAGRGREKESVSAESSPASAPPPAADPVEERILVSEVEIRGVSGELAAVARGALTVRPNFAYTLEEVQEDVNRVFQTGFFSTCQPVAEDTRDGVKVILDVKPNPVLSGVVVVGADALPTRVVQDAFAAQFSRTLNFQAFNQALRALNAWYEERGVLGSVLDAQLSEAGICELRCAEAHVRSVAVRTLDPATGEPCAGRTKHEVVQRALTLRPGCVYSVRQARRDLDAIYSTGVFEDVSLVPSAAATGEAGAEKGEEGAAPGAAGTGLDLTVSLVERKTGGFSAGGGMSARGLKGGALSGMVGSCAYTQKNLFGLNQKLSASLEMGSIEKLFRVSHTDPWVGSGRARVARTLSLANTRGSGAATHGRTLEPSPEQAAACRAAAASTSG